MDAVALLIAALAFLPGVAALARGGEPRITRPGSPAGERLSGDSARNTLRME
jgi:hypothetical protein